MMSHDWAHKIVQRLQVDTEEYTSLGMQSSVVRLLITSLPLMVEGAYRLIISRRKLIVCSVSAVGILAFIIRLRHA